MRGLGRWILAGLIVAACVISPPDTMPQTRVFYRAEQWLATSPETQLLLVRGTLRAWEQLAESAENQGLPGGRLPIREREALRLVECIHLHPGLTLEQVRQAIQLHAIRHREEIFSAFGDLAAQALVMPCRRRDPE